ncbi:DUF6929 family protein [Gemmatimonas groenlandica]|uniref:DUF3616 domain-containing protein n=1 Tax=Gemmatimonas groenlandica TaxID=2732249 RepID=A0A6M4IHY8_9BACT|nr:hypothetical protein [Gemmatimonas groenlandica]QJR34714.1 hypothetical protein HKW67_03890 [Gemmatimonas groenlandica]
MIHAQHDPALVVRLVRQLPLHYADGADPSVDRPAHVRAGSGLAWVGERLAIVQDDANFIALVDPASGHATAVVLPAGESGVRQFDTGRGNKKQKFDLEALVSVDSPDGPFLLAIGSGSSKRRERMVTVKRAGEADEALSLIAAPGLYDVLRQATDFSGSDMNIEGAVCIGDVLRLFGRGNGEASKRHLPLDATCDLHWPSVRDYLDAPDSVEPPMPRRLRQYSLGEANGVRLSFTDATVAWGDRSAQPVVLYTAAAEGSPDSRRDGEVAGSAIGFLDPRCEGTVMRYALLRDMQGELLPLKVEGIACGRADQRQVFVVLDVDNPDAPSMLCELRLEGPWPSLDTPG